MSGDIKSKTVKSRLPSEKKVIEYLQQNPNFFESHTKLLTEIDIPHSSGGAISLIERQVGELRKKNTQLNAEILNLLHLARENDSLSESLHRLTIELMECGSSDEVVAALYDSLKDSFGVEQVVVLLPNEENSKTHDKFEKLLHNSTPFCGQLSEEQRSTVFGDDITHGASVALLPLNGFGDDTQKRGIIALGNKNPEHYHEKMGAHFLSQIATLVSAALMHVYAKK